MDRLAPWCELAPLCRISLYAPSTGVRQVFLITQVAGLWSGARMLEGGLDVSRYVSHGVLRYDYNLPTLENFPLRV